MVQDSSAREIKVRDVEDRIDPDLDTVAASAAPGVKLKLRRRLERKINTTRWVFF